jgi:3-oxosteroid 1-dehydrogenase
LAPHISSGYISVGDTVQELAEKIGVDQAGLTETVRLHNEYAQTGIDPDFKRGTNPFNTILLGDPSFKPNPNLGTIDTSSLVALRIYPSTLGTCIGLATNSDAQVLNDSGTPIKGLYACGQDVSSVMRGYYPGGGINIGPAIVFAFIAVRHIANSA